MPANHKDFKLASSFFMGFFGGASMGLVVEKVFNMQSRSAATVGLVYGIASFIAEFDKQRNRNVPFSLELQRACHTFIYAMLSMGFVFGYLKSLGCDENQTLLGGPVGMSATADVLGTVYGHP